MSGFITGVFTFPTIFFSGLLILVILYWVTTMFGFSGAESADSDIALDADLEATDSTPALAHILSKFRLDDIPLTITVSLVTLVSWMISFLAVYFFYPLIPDTWVRVAISLWILLLTPVLSATLLSPLLQSLKPLFKKERETRAVDLVGEYATVRSGKVTATIGEALFHNGGAGLLLKIRCTNENTLTKGDSVKLFSFDETTGIYQITY